MIVKGVGCSFVLGCEHQDFHPKKYSHTTWPAIIAKKQAHEYKCFAKAGCGNLHILNDILNEIEKEQDDFYIINWTWIMRWDYIFSGNNTWHHLNPNHDHERSRYYYQHIHADYTDKLHNLIWINTAIQSLTAAGKRFCMTYMDNLLFENRWHTSAGISNLQNQIHPHLHQFENLNFVDWSKQNNFVLGSLGHPLEDAHYAAAEYLLNYNLV